jgi:hypothetical protein
MKTKVYLAKSNRSNPDDVSRVRTLLSKFDVDIVEFTGGQYTNEQLLECDYLFVVPELDNLSQDRAVLGKGLHNQVSDFFFRNPDKFESVYCFIGDQKFKLFDEEYDYLDYNDYVTHSSWLLSDFKLSVDKILDTYSVLKNSYYVLINK